jgi:uncharacterized protein DUF2442
LAISLHCDENLLHIELVDGREVSAPLGWFPRLRAATPVQREAWELIGRGEGFHWEELDEDISVASILGLPVD